MRFLIVFFLFVSAAVAENNPSSDGLVWLKKVGEAMKSHNYHGTVVFMKNGQIDTMRYQHTFEQGVEFEKLTSLNSPLREVIRKSSEIRCLYKETSQKIEASYPLDRSFIVNLPLQPDKASEQYLLAVAGQEMIAMHPAQIIAILPKDELRYARKIWVDTENFLPLKVEVYGLGGQAIEQVMFTELELDQNQPASEPAVAESAPAHGGQIERVENPPFELKNWPVGFEKKFFIRNTMQQSKKTVEHLMISDGFSNISIYFEAQGDKPLEGPRSLGPVNLYGRVIGNWQVTVLGEVPAQTVELVASGLSPR